MRLTPIEIRQHRFNHRFWGCDSHEVESFLQTVVEDFEEVVRENARLRREAERLGRDLEEHRSRERTIQETLTTAQGVVDQLKRTAVKEAEVLVSEAEVRAEKIVSQADVTRAELAKEIAELRQLRRRLGLELRQTIEGYTSLIDAYEESLAEAAPDEKDRSLGPVSGSGPSS
jgi:cell division initiation protein